MLSPGIPGFAKRGVCLVGVAKCAFPQPPLPPLSMTCGSGVERSATIRPVSASLIKVPCGTLITKSSAFFPLQRFFLPFSPFGAKYFLL